MPTVEQRVRTWALALLWFAAVLALLALAAWWPWPLADAELMMP
jgi:hypothetical protein